MEEAQVQVFGVDWSVDYLNRIARVCHEVNRAYCQALGDESQVPWYEAPDWQRQSCRDGVAYHLSHPGGCPEDSHINWCEHKKREGWIYGPEKDEEAKTHPCLVPYDELPVDQRAKDHIFVAIVRELHENILTESVGPE